MSATSTSRILLIGDADQVVSNALAHAVPGVRTTSVESVFDALAVLRTDRFDAVVSAVEPIERRPEAAVRSLRASAGDAAVVLFGHATLEPLSRKMMQFGVDDYFVSPASATELRQVFGQPVLRVSPARDAPDTNGSAADIAAGELSERLAGINALPLAEILLDALIHHPQSAVQTAVEQINAHLGPAIRLHYTPAPAQIVVDEGMTCLRHPVRAENQSAGELQLILPRDEDEAVARHLLAHVAQLMGRCRTLDQRHRRLQRLAITDDLTGLYNARWFRHFLDRILEKARQRRFPVTLLLFDIDNFKAYNDQHGHGVGDEILRQTGRLMRRCCRDHDMVARIAGDEFAVIFWDNEPPRVPREPGATVTPARVPQTPLQIAERFQRLLQSNEFTALGQKGQGKLTISGGLAVYPYDARDAAELIAAADKALMFGAKRSGKNRISLVGATAEP